MTNDQAKGLCLALLHAESEEEVASVLGSHGYEDDDGCPDGQQCHHLSSDKPDQCAPEEGVGATGDFCLSDFDCQSGTCEAEAVLRTCNVDGRPCTSDSECIVNAETGACTEVGYYDGMCR